MGSAIRILPLLVFCFVRVMGDAKASSKLSNPFLSHSHRPQLIAFNTFFTIPLNHVRENGEPSPLLTVNTRGLSVAGILTAILTLAVPLFSKGPGPGMHYRSTEFGV